MTSKSIFVELQSRCYKDDRPLIIIDPAALHRSHRTERNRPIDRLILVVRPPSVRRTFGARISDFIPSRPPTTVCLIKRIALSYFPLHVSPSLSLDSSSLSGTRHRGNELNDLMIKSFSTGTAEKQTQISAALQNYHFPLESLPFFPFLLFFLFRTLARGSHQRIDTCGTLPLFAVAARPTAL